MTTQHPWRRPAAALHLAGAGLFLAGLALTPWEQENTAASYHDALAASPDQAQAAALVLHFSYALLAAGAFALLGVLGTGAPAGRWWRRAGAPLVVLGATTMPGLLITDAYDLALAQAPSLDRDASAAVSDAVGETLLAGVIGASAMLGFIVGPLLLWVAAWRQRVVPGTVPALVLAAWIVGFASMELPVMLAGAALLIAAYGLASATLWWERPSAETRAITGFDADGEPGAHLEPATGSVAGA